MPKSPNARRGWHAAKIASFREELKRRPVQKKDYPKIIEHYRERIDDCFDSNMETDGLSG